MTVAVRAALNDLTADVARTARREHGEILEAAFVGNPIMHHLLLGIDPVGTRRGTFCAVHRRSRSRSRPRNGLAAPNARVYVLPCIAGHVGADTAGVILAERPDLRSELTLLVDVGTNAEIVLGNRDRLLACSSPPVPPSRGRRSAGGQRAAPGAIERVRIDPVTLEPRYKIIGSRSLVGRSGLCRRDRGDRRHRHVRIGHHRGGRGNVPRGHHQSGWRA